MPTTMTAVVAQLAHAARRPELPAHEAQPAIPCAQGPAGAGSEPAAGVPTRGPAAGVGAGRSVVSSSSSPYVRAA
jgi:hypothetical protein